MGFTLRFIKESIRDSVKVYAKYDWVCIDGNGISIGIQFECHLMSGNKPLHLFEEQLKNNKFTCWRFVGDSKYLLEDKDEYKYLKMIF